ncbi:MAG: transglutaminase-like domain-containing protein [Clostridiales bacterium]|nr:transglutaminase-like domain-containing protein [Clostridiales bacterium]
MRNPKRIPALLLALSLVFCLLAGCGKTEQEAAQPEGETTKYSTDEMTVESNIYTDAVTVAAAPLDVYLEDAPVPMVAPEILMPEASGVAVEKNDKAEIDYSNITDGYVMARFTAATEKRLKVQVAGPTTTYNYDLPAGNWVTYPLSDGNGSYKVMVLENTTGSKYAVVASVSFQVTLKDEFAPFLRPNQYVDYAAAPNTVAKAAELTQGVTDPLAKVEKVYSFVVKSLTYDKEKAQTVKSGYLPVLDTVLAEKKGICFDYAALMAGMLRSQGIPCKLVVGYAGTAYHAWISVWTEASGWVEGAIYFDGTTWQRMDPTFASSGKGSESIMKYIGDGSNYTVKYLY